MFSYHAKDSMGLPPDLGKFKKRQDSIKEVKNPGSSHMVNNLPFLRVALIKIDEKTRKVSDSLFKSKVSLEQVLGALNQTRMIKSTLLNMNANRANYVYEYKVFEVQWHKILSYSVSCIVMFLIGAPLGAIIKKGGLGVPVIVSIFFFILFYLIMSTGEKWAGQEKISVPVGIWAADVLLTVVGLLFLRQARLDARLFEADFYSVLLDKVKRRLRPQKVPSAEAI